MPDARRTLGTDIENQVARYLSQQGYQILERQYKTKFGEIDLVFQDGDEVVFVEVKARSSQAFGYPEESVHVEKMRKIVSCAHLYMQQMNYEPHWRIDVVSVELSKPIHITHLKAVDIPDEI